MQQRLLECYFFIKEFNVNQLSKLSKGINIIYRNYDYKIDEKNLILLKNLSRSKKFKIYLSNNLKLAIKHEFDGLYLPSFNKIIKKNFLIDKKKFKIIGSAHNIPELIIKKKQGCEQIFLSPLFKSTKNTSYLDVVKFNLISKKFNNNFVALGGINEKNIRKLQMLKISGFAGISYFQKKTAPWWGRLNI